MDFAGNLASLFPDLAASSLEPGGRKTLAELGAHLFQSDIKCMDTLDLLGAIPIELHGLKPDLFWIFAL